ncbi:PREDICTED: zinc finger protein 425-like [Nicrophorus vespilloides]|uniref:Zinc finger protein 425-like n=1 Tax=Nicrophorus vespilloides TaxID=110193 RepID=A0ABM1N9I1_NICVS|nr:PREDICTED: zinc finger protein 425-like [Nicrophorus vespilloides]
MYSSEKALKRHVQFYCDAPRRFSCVHCQKRYRHRESLARHQKHVLDQFMMRDNYYLCPQCPKFYLRKNTIKRHLRYECGKQPQFRFSGGVRCPKCDRTYKWHKTMKRHLTYECGILPKFVCKFCSKAFYQKYALKTHLRGFHKVSNSSIL